MYQVDLHMHTTRSDGRKTPTELVDMLGVSSLKFAAITDHDSTEGLDEAFIAVEAYPELTLIPGVELSTDVEGGEIHILVYHVDRTNDDFQRALSKFRDGRIGRGQEMVEKLTSLGMPISFERVLELAGDASVGRPHVARALLEKGHVDNIQEAFDKYLGRNGPAYAERDKLRPEEAIKLATDLHALPVLAHPGYVNNLEEWLPELKASGLVGMEVYYGKYDTKTVAYLKTLADTYDLVPCGGSDYHGMGYDDEVEPGTAGPPTSTIDRLAAIKPL